MDALQLLTRDHDNLKRLIGDYQAIGDAGSARKQQIAAEIFREVQLHSRLEEEIFYPALNAKASRAGRERIEDALDAHAYADELIQELKTLDPDSVEHHERFQVLIRQVATHIHEEESALFPEAQRKLGAELQTIGRELEEEKDSAAAELI